MVVEPIVGYGSNGESFIERICMAAETPREVALRALRKHLAAADSDSGRLPPERELASQMKVGRRTVRQALSVLELEGAIWRRQGQGTFFGQPKLVSDREVVELAHRVNPLEIIEARLSVEPVLARLRLMRASRAEIRAVMRAARSIRAPNDGGGN